VRFKIADLCGSAIHQDTIRVSQCPEDICSPDHPPHKWHPTSTILFHCWSSLKWASTVSGRPQFSDRTHRRGRPSRQLCASGCITQVERGRAIVWRETIVEVLCIRGGSDVRSGRSDLLQSFAGHCARGHVRISERRRRRRRPEHGVTPRRRAQAVRHSSDSTSHSPDLRLQPPSPRASHSSPHREALFAFSGGFLSAGAGADRRASRATRGVRTPRLCATPPVNARRCRWASPFVFSA
jgi:hypothetical protein